MIWQVGLYVAAVLIPLAAFAVEAIFIRQLKHLNAYIATGAIGMSCLLSLIGFVDYFVFAPEVVGAAHYGESNEGESAQAPAAEHTSPAPEHHKKLVWAGSVDWVLLGGTAAATDERAGVTYFKPDLVVPLGVAIDGLSVIMFLMVTFVATLIHIYSIGYMHGDNRYPRFFAYLSLFCFSMLGLVASSNVFMIFIFWELVGLCSYLLIGFWYEEKVNCDAANKAFIVNRIGDVGMLVGLGLLWTSLGSFGFQEINQGLRSSSGELHVAPGTGGVEVAQFIDRESGKVVIDSVTGQHVRCRFGC